MGIKSRFLCLIVLLLGSILKVEAQEILTKEQLNDSTYTSRLDGVYVLVDKTYNTILSFKKGKSMVNGLLLTRIYPFGLRLSKMGKGRVCLHRRPYMEAYLDIMIMIRKRATGVK